MTEADGLKQPVSCHSGKGNDLTEEDIKTAEEFFTYLKEDTEKIQDLSLDKLYSVQLNSSKTLLSAKSFEEMNLKKELLNAVYAMGIEKPSTIQQHAIPHILSGSHVAFQSCSGTGKTIAFVLGSLNRAVPREGPQVIILTPTRELCNQVANVAEGLAGPVGLRVFRLLSDVSLAPISDEIIVGCPGKVKSFLDKGMIEPSNIKILVLDEADELINIQQFSVQTVKIFRHLKNAQKVLFSATFSDVSKDLVRKFLPNADTFFDVNSAAQKLKFFYLDFGTKDKTEAIKEMLCYITVAQVIIFCNRRTTVETTAAAFRNDQYSVSAIHGKMEPAVRDDSFARFAQAKTKILVTTDVFSRGMDIAQVNLIINYDLPISMSGPDGETPANTYIHRVGRSGRFNRSGFVVDIMGGDDFLQRLEDIQKEARVTSRRLKLAALRKVFEKNELDALKGY